MSSKSKVLGLLSALIVALAALVYLFGTDPATTGGGSVAGADPTRAAERRGGAAAERIGDAGDRPGGRTAVAADPATITGVRGVVLDLKTRQPLPGVEVVAMRMVPNLERPMTRLRSLFRDGLYIDTSRPAEILGSTMTQGDGSFELTGLPPGRVFLDARSDRAFIRNPGLVHLARGQVQEGVELLASPGGRIVGTVYGPEGTPSKNTRVSVRPGLNSFLGQLTQRKYKWLEATTDEDGRYEIAGVPTGDGYSVTFASPEMALEERHGIGMEVGRTVRIDLRGKIGAHVSGRVVDADGAAVEGAQIAMVYLDVSRMLFSADGRDESVRTDAEGRFQMQHVAPGRVAFIAATEDLAPSNIHELAVVDGGIYNDVLLTLDAGRTFSGLVVDGEDRPLAGVVVEIRPFDFDPRQQQRGADALKMALKIRRVTATTGADGRYSTTGITGDRMMMQFEKPGYIKVTAMGVKVDTKDFKVALTRGVTVRGKVQLADGTPVTRFQVQARPREERRRRRGDRGAEAGASDPAAAVEESVEERPGGFRVQVGGGPRRGRGMWGRTSIRRSREGADDLDRGPGRDRWDEVKNAEGRFSAGGFPSGEMRIRVRAEGFLEPEERVVTLEPGATSEELVFVVDPGAVCRGVVLDEATRQPVAEATVTAYPAKKQEDRGGFSLFRPDADGEDFDFLGLQGREGRRSTMTDSKGRFEITGLAGGDFRLTARHPDMAKESVKDVAMAPDRPTEGVEILLGSGGAIEGLVTGKGKLPLVNAMVIAFSLQAGSMKSDATDERGVYRIDGLPPGMYIVFKSKMNERSQDIGLDLMSNMRIKATTVLRNKTTRRDIHDESDDSVRIFGVVRDNGKPVPRAVITMLGRDRDGILGMGIRTKPTEDDGSYEIIGLEAGEYLAQVARFSNRAEQSSITVVIPKDVREFRLDIDLPQSFIEGIVQDTRGNPVSGIQVQAGMQGEAPVAGLLGIMLKNGIGQARTGADGRFKVKGLAAGLYRVTATGRGVRFGGGLPGRSRGRAEYGQVAVGDLRLDGVNPHTGLVLVLPRAGSVTGVVVDADGNPVVGAEVHAASDDPAAKRQLQSEQALVDLFGLQMRPAKSGADGRFEVTGLTPGRYRVRADIQGLAPGTADDVVVQEGQPTEVRLRVIKGATLHVRVRNIDGKDLPLANISVLDSKGKPLASKVSVMSVFLRYMKGRQTKDSSGWHEIGDIPPDTYTVIIQEQGQPDLRIVRTVRDGEVARWDIDMAAELEALKGSRK